VVRGAPVPVAMGPALGVLRSAERHLGRWLVLAEVAVKAGDRSPLDEAKQKSEVGPPSARAAWSLVHWALSETALAAGHPQTPVPRRVRPPATRAKAAPTGATGRGYGWPLAGGGGWAVARVWATMAGRV